ncbi:hypothetical protein [Thiomicrorhabdus sp.]|uniref:hypothetical protein n=1 Tax=Thiomicrorhabdus sp. TaxID=2039724 RepID=UPI003561D051
MKNVLISASIAAVLGLTACSSMATQSADSYDAIVADATATQAKAAEMKNVWQQKAMKLSYVDHYLDLAAKAKEKGDEAKAVAMAKEAQKTAHAEVAQIEQNANLKAAWEK